MGAPIVRADELDARLKANRAQLRKEYRAEIAEALAPVLAALELSEPEAGIPTPLEVAEAAGEVPPAPVTGFENIDKDDD